MRRVPTGFALVLASIELLGIIDWHPTLAEVLDGVLSAALVFALFSTVFALARLVSAGPFRAPSLALLHLFIAALSVVLYVSWMARILLGQPVSGEVTRFITESPVASVLQLRESERALLGLLLIGLLLFLYVSARVLNLAAREPSQRPPRTRTVAASVFAALSFLLAWRVSEADLTWSSYALVLLPDEGAREVPSTYSCPRSPPVPKAAPPAGAGNGTPMIVILIDSLRSDLLQQYPQAVPFLDRLAKESVVFARPYATSSHSDFTDLSVWYSRYPLYAEQRLGYPADAKWRGTSAFEFFRMRGYRTAYFSSQDERWGRMINWLKIDAVETFFDANNFAGPDRAPPPSSGGSITDALSLTVSGKVEDSRTLQLAGDWAVQHAKEPFFLGMNLQNTHYPYIIPEGGAEPFQPAELPYNAVRLKKSAKPSAVKLRNRLLNAALNVDADLARLAERLRLAGVWDRAAVLIVGDNGEAFGEHGYLFHGGRMHDEQSRTLAILKLPKGDARNGTVFEPAMSHIDFVPALVDVAGLPAWNGFQGSSPFVTSRSRPLFMLVNAVVREYDVVRWPWKLLSRTFPERVVELYDLQADPRELHNIARLSPHTVADLSREVETWRTCQLSYYSDSQAYTQLAPPRFH